MVKKHNHSKENLEFFIKGLISKTYTLKQVSDFTGYSIVHLSNLKKKYQQKGKSIFINGHKGKKSKNAVSAKIKKEIVKIYQTDFQGFNFLFFKKALLEFYNIDYSYKTIYRILTENKIASPEKHRVPKKEKVHRPRYRRESEGDLIQLDATPFEWFLWNGDCKKYALHGAIDDATGKITGLFLSENECSYGYYEVLTQTFNQYGLPHETYTDQSAIFCCVPRNKNELTIQEQLDGMHEKRTQWQRIMFDFAINQILAWSPQAKGRVERMWRTLQGRLPWYFRKYKIETIEEANKFLQEKYIEIFNEEFSIEAKKESVWRLPPVNYKDNLCAKFIRHTNSAGVISFQSCKFQVKAPRCACTDITLCIYSTGLKALINQKYYPVIPLEDIGSCVGDVMSESLKNIIYKYMYSDAKKVSA